jgi:TFIIF-interacting CTD phosphatase-like protein
MPRRNNKKFNIILDLDQTLISAENYDYFIKDGEKSKEEYISRDNKTKLDYVEMDKDYIVYLRPGLDEFLDEIFSKYNVSIWTAASKNYAMFIIDKVILPDNKPKRKLEYVFFSYHCDESIKNKGKSKDLSMLWDVYNISNFSKNNTIIIDDYDEVRKTQPENCIQIKPFKFIKESSENDGELNKILKLIPIRKNKLKSK